DGQVAGALEQRRRTTLRARQEALHGRARADDGRAHHELRDAHLALAVDRVGDRRLQQLLRDPRAVLGREVQDGHRRLHVLAADQLENLVRLAGRDPDVPDDCFRFHLSLPSAYLPGTAAFSTGEPWPRNTRVGTNSPSLWPTMFSDT